MIVILVLIMTMGGVCAADDISDDIISDDGQKDMCMVSEASFTDLTDEIEHTDVLNLTRDYIFNNETDDSSGIIIGKDNFVLNGNGRTIDGNNQSRIFNITANNVTLSNLILTGGNAEKGGAIYATGLLTLTNITFIDNYASKQGAAVGLYENVTIKCDNSRFIDNDAVEKGSAIYLDKGELDLSNTNMTSKFVSKSAQITAYKNAIIYIENVTFADTTSTYSPALHIQRSNVSIINSRFKNLKADITAGAISLKECEDVYIKNCEFINTTSSKNGGAIYADISGDLDVNGTVTIIDTSFKDTFSEFGGAYLQLGGNLFLDNTNFTNNHATYNGGAIYLSHVTSNITNCNFTSNGVDIIAGYPTYGGAIYNDISTLNIDKSKFINNNAIAGTAIGAYDSSYNIKNTLFENNRNPIYTFFDKESILENNVYINDDNISTNNTLYATIISGQGLELTLLNNSINVTTLPSRFDLRDWGWMSPVKDQGWMGACWTFGMTGTLESALLKAAGITTDFSENNMRDTMLKYSIYGSDFLAEGGTNLYSTSYLLSWLGAIAYDADIYDEMGKISAVITTLNDIHIQDVIFLPNNEIPNGTKLKEAILKYGSLDVCYFGQSTYDEKNPYYNPDTYAQYVNETKKPNHEVSIIGWDDNYPKENFLITPPGNGAWIIKNSWGSDFGEKGCMYVSYYDKTLLESTDLSSYATAIIAENTIPYNKNYQYAMIWGGNFMSGETVSYMNVFEALENDAIAAVGTYFKEEGVNYTVEIYVNNESKLIQEGVSPYLGYHTIKLNEYIPIKKGDVFKAVITSNNIPYITLGDVRIHYTENISYVSIDGSEWEDSYKSGAIACLKVYTVALPIYTENLVKIYKNDSQFEAVIGIVNETVTFEINGRTYNRTSDENGTARIAINLGPGNYTIKTIFNGTAVENTITVLPTLIADNLVKYYRNASQFDISLIDGEGNPVSGVNITMNINGVFYNRTTNENGTARLNINLPPGEYILTAIDPLTGLMMSYNITVLSTLNATDLEMTYQDGSTFNVTVLDGQGKPLANVAVRFNINGVFYTKHTDSKGIAKLNINLMSGKYIITSEYDGLKISNTISIKDLIN